MMPNYTAGSTRVALDQPDTSTLQNDTTVVLDSRRTRPLWFDGRFLAARDLEREQNYFLQREADLAQGAGFENLTGLMVDRGPGPSNIIIRAGDGYTPAGELVAIPSDLTVALSDIPADAGQSTGTRSGLYAIALRPVEYTGDPVGAFPTTIGGARTTRDGDVIAATAVTLIPYPDPPTGFPPALQQAALARQVFLVGNPAKLPDSVLPLAVVSLNAGVIQWLDPYIIRRDTGVESSSVRFGLNDAAIQRAYLSQFDAQLQSVVLARQANGLKANLTASDFFRSLPPAGRFPMDAINTTDFSQVFFPQEMDVRLSIVPDDEIPALFADSLSLPPIDLTLSPEAYSSIGVLALIPVPRDGFAALEVRLPDAPLVPILPQVLANRSPLQLLRLYQGVVPVDPAPPLANTAWASAIGAQKFGYYIRRRAKSTFVPFSTPTGVTLASSTNPSTVGQPVTLRATVSPRTATGNITFREGGASLGAVAIAAGVATLTISTLSPGAHSIVAEYSGDGTHAAETSPPLSQAIKAAAAIAVTSSANPSDPLQPVTFTATLTPNTATGSIQFRDGGSVLGSANLASGAAKLSTSSLTAGAHAITAAYGGDDNFGPGASDPLIQTVRAASSTALASSLNPSTAGQAVSFTAKVTPATASGTVQFRDGGNAIGSSPLSAGAATLSVSNLSTGAHSVAAVYGGDAANTGSTSAPVAQTVRVASSVALTSSANPSNAQQQVVFTASVTPSNAAGNISFMDGSTPLGVSALSGGAATLAASALSPGTHSITATYDGDAGNGPAISPSVAQLVKALSSVTLTSAVNPSNPQQPVTLTATVSPAAATGSIQFMEGTTLLGVGVISAGVAVLNTGALAPGAHSIAAAYAGDNNTAASVSNPLAQTVRAASTLALTSSLNPSTFQQPVTFTAALTPKTGSGNIQFLDNGAPMGSGALAAGVATLTTTALTVGAHSVTASYPGDNGAAASASNAVAQTVRAQTKVALASAVNPSNPQQSVTFSATVTPATATGSVQFLDSTTIIGTVMVSAGVATFATGTLSPGPHSITANYAGDANHAPGASPALIQTVRAPSTVAIASSANPSNVQQPVTFTVNVTPSTATGKVGFFDGAVVIATALLSGGAASTTITTLTAGSHTVFASYVGDNNTLPSPSPQLTQVVRASATVALTSSVSPSNPQQPVSFTAKVTPFTATGSIQFLDGAALLGTVAITAGAATLPIATLAPGQHSITAVYSGDSNNAGTTSNVVPQIVRAASSATLSSSLNPSNFQQPVTFTVTVTPAIATGSVQFADGTAPLGSAPLNGGAASITVATLAAGSHTMSAFYVGDNNHTPVSPQSLVQTVKAVTTVSISSSANPSNLQQAVTFTALVNPKSATGAVQFSADGNALGAGPLNGGVANLTVTTLAPGVHSITAEYPGDSVDLPATSAALAQTVRNISTVALVSSANPSNFQQTVSLRATVNPPSATGNVVFQEIVPTAPAPIVLGSVALSGGNAGLKIATLSAGSHTLSATYQGDANNVPSTSQSLTQVVRTPTTVGLGASAQQVALGQPLTLTARVAATGATGSIQFFDGANPIGSVAVNVDAVSVLTIATLKAGAHTITAVYSGDAAHGPGTSQPVAVSIG